LTSSIIVTGNCPSFWLALSNTSFAFLRASSAAYSAFCAAHIGHIIVGFGFGIPASINSCDIFFLKLIIKSYTWFWFYCSRTFCWI
jgi:hypothetical protein